MKETKNNHDVAQFDSGLDWLAFCYVAGELSAQQAAEFEQRLAEDLDAQVAVADAVSMCASTYASIETFQADKVSLGCGQTAETDRSSTWRWVAVAAAGLVAIVSLWQMLPASPGNEEVAHKSSGRVSQKAGSAIAISEVDLWDRTVEMYQSANPHGDQFEIWALSSVDESFGSDGGELYVSGDDGSQEIADALQVDSDLASIFASALSSIAPSEGEM